MDFALGQHIIAMEKARRLKVQFQVVYKGDMTTLPLVIAKPLESNVDMVLVRFEGLSNTVICSCQWSQETRWIC